MRPISPRAAGVGFAILCLVIAGCKKPHLDQALLKQQAGPGARERLVEQYAVRYPDVVNLQIAGHKDLSGPRPLSVEGKITLRPGVELRPEGHAAPVIARQVADQLGLPASSVQVTVVGYNSQRLFIQGEIKGETRAVPYVGPETILDMLQRVGGITSGANVEEIEIVRAHVAEGAAPEVFQVDLSAILLKNDQASNIRLRPYDQIYVGRKKTCRIKQGLPRWMHPLCDKLFDLSRPDDEPYLPLRARGFRSKPGLDENNSPRYRAYGSEE